MTNELARDYDLIVFDWDGTLMDSEIKIVRCIQAAARDIGAPVPANAEARRIIGLGLAEAVATLFPALAPAQRTALTDAYREHFLHHDQTEMPLFTGVREGLEDLAACGYRLAVATGKARRGLNRVLAETALAHLFAATRCADEAFSKPHPKMLEDILELTGTDAARAILVGDTVYDLAMARSAGVAALAVTYGVHTREELEAEAPLACLDSFSSVHAWLTS
jgi:phosphoglycolate phosphatase